jgi:hypothetical protein
MAATVSYGSRDLGSSAARRSSPPPAEDNIRLRSGQKAVEDAAHHC